MSKTIVVAFDNWQLAEAAVAQASALAIPLSASVLLLGILSTGDSGVNGEFVDPVLWSVTRSEFEANVKRYAEQLQEKHIETEIKIVKTLFVGEICQQLEGQECHLIVFPVDNLNPSPLIQSLLRHTKVPVLLARATVNAPSFMNILVPLDGSQRAESSLNLASSIVKAIAGKLHLVHVVQQPEFPRHTSRSTQEMELEQQLNQRNTEEAKRYLDQVASRLGVDTTNHILADNKVTTSLHSLIVQHNIDLLILSAHGHSGESQWTLGTIAENLVRYAEIPTIVMQDLPANLTHSTVDAARVQAEVR